MGRLIDEDAVIKAILQLDGLIYTIPDYIDAVHSVPTAEPESRREWYMKGYRDAQNAAMHESCTDCPLYDHDRHNCPRFNKVIPTAIRDAQPRWIPCTERLPEEDNCTGSGVQYSDDVLITVINTMDEETVIDYGHTIDGEWYSETTDCFIPHGWKPIAWMPLPEPYKEGQE